MEAQKRLLSKLFPYLSLCLFVCIALASSSAQKAYDSTGWDGSYGQQTIQVLHQTSQGGTYVGIADSEEEARQMASKAGFSRYQYYPSTGTCFGY